MADAEAATILADLKRMGACFDLTRDRLGERLLDLVSAGAARNSAAEVDPDGNAWPELSEAYAEAKSRSHPGKPIGVREGLMLDPEQLAGLRRITPTAAAMDYGTSEEARDEARHFTEGGRPFWGITAEADQQCTDLLDQRFIKAVEG